MQTQIQKQVFNNIMQELDIKPARTNADNFNEWMRNKVKSIYYGNNEMMTRALNKIDKY